MRFVLLQLGEDDHVVLMNMHHIVSDAWSLGIFSRELTALFAAVLTLALTSPANVAQAKKPQDGCVTLAVAVDPDVATARPYVERGGRYVDSIRVDGLLSGSTTLNISVTCFRTVWFYT